jgi:hypothetical protein
MDGHAEGLGEEPPDGFLMDQLAHDLPRRRSRLPPHRPWGGMGGSGHDWDVA